ncbi:MAG: hypothetical protein LBI45_09040 [Bacteroidales bacterium]|jgi:hypothetical protein|nr:hypothetical protein [Bacteroidales bacterium]
MTAFFVMAACSISCKKLEDCNCIDSNGCEKIEISKKEYLMKCMIPEEASINSVNKLIICNHTKNIMNYGHTFSLEHFEESSWTEIPLYINWEDILLGIDSFDTLEWEMNLYSLVEQHNDFKKGKYRISKNISLRSNEKHSMHIGNYSFNFEFEIK